MTSERLAIKGIVKYETVTRSQSLCIKYLEQEGFEVSFNMLNEKGEAGIIIHSPERVSGFAWVGPRGGISKWAFLKEDMFTSGRGFNRMLRTLGIKEEKS